MEAKNYGFDKISVCTGFINSLPIDEDADFGISKHRNERSNVMKDQNQNKKQSNSNKNDSNQSSKNLYDNKIENKNLKDKNENKKSF